MAQTNTKYREVYGTEAKYKANPAKYANDKYICTDTGVMYVKGIHVKEGGWVSLVPYYYDRDTKIIHHCAYKLLTIGTNHVNVTLRIRGYEDANYPSYSEWVLRINFAGGTFGKCVTLTPSVPGNKTLTVYIDSDYGIWVKADLEWSSSLELRSEKGTMPEIDIDGKVLDTPENVVQTIVNSGNSRNGAAYSIQPKLLAPINWNKVESTPTTLSGYGITDAINTSRIKTASSETHTNWDTDKAKVPDINMLSYWNGAYNSKGTSHLTYCKKGAFGNLAVKDNLPIDNSANRSDCLQFMQTQSTDIVDKPTEDNWYHIIKMNHKTGDTYFKRVLAFGFNSNRILTNYAISNGVLRKWQTLAFLEDIPTSPSSLKGTLYCDPSTGEFHCAGMDDDFSEAPLASVKEKLEIPTIYSLTVKGSAGTLNAKFDPDSKSEEIDITPASIGAATATALSSLATDVAANQEAIDTLSINLNTTAEKADAADLATKYFAVSSTAAATAAKTATITDFALVKGATVRIQFSASNTAANPTLNITNTGAKAIRYGGSAITASYLKANRIYTFLYDGTYWQLVGDINTDTNTTYTLATATKDGLMPKEMMQLLNTPANTDKNGYMSSEQAVKLAGIEEGANKYVHPAYTARTGYPTANATPGFGSTFSVSQIVTDAKGHVTAANTRTVKIPNTVATTSAAGLMSADDKRKLESIGGSCYIHIQTIIGLQNGSSFNGYGFFTSASNMIHAIIDAMKEGKKITFTNVTKSQLDDYLERENQNDGAGFYLLNAEFCMYESQTATTGRIFMRRAVYENEVSGIKIEFNKSSSSSTFTNIKVTSF